MKKNYLLIFGVTIGSFNLLSQQELILNGSFESGDQFWDITSANSGYADEGGCEADDGLNYLWFGDIDELTGINNIDDEEVSQTVSLPSNLDFAEFSYRWSGTSDEQDDVDEWDFLYVDIYDENGDIIFSAVHSNADLNPSLTVSLCDEWSDGVAFTIESQYAGQDIEVVFTVYTDDLLPTIFRVDNVSILVETTSAGLSESAVSLLDISPNPANETINIMNSNSNNDITIFSCEGREISSFTLTLGINTINISELPQGLYFIKETNGAVTKIIKE